MFNYDVLLFKKINKKCTLFCHRGKSKGRPNQDETTFGWAHLTTS